MQHPLLGKAVASPVACVVDLGCDQARHYDVPAQSRPLSGIASSLAEEAVVLDPQGMQDVREHDRRSHVQRSRPCACRRHRKLVY